jgi:uncharacterized protein with HEPN domain
MRPDDRIRLIHMLEAVREARGFADGRGRVDLDNDKMLLRALVKDIEIIGEAASKVTDETRTATPSIPWTIIVATRNRLIHAYFDLDLDRLWETVVVDLPSLEASLVDALGSATPTPSL